MANDNQISIDVLLAVEQANQRLRRLEQGIEKFGNNAQGTFGKMSLAWGSFVGNLGAQAVTKALDLTAAAAQRLFKTFVMDGIRAASAQEDATNELNTALALTGIYSDSVSRGMHDLATELQATTKYSDDMVLKSMALLQNLGRLDQEGLKRATRASADLAAVLKVDLVTASELLGKAAQGNVAAFGRYGLAVQKGADNAKTFENVLRLIETRFSGAAAAQVNTYSGAIALASNAFGEMQEATGAFIVRNPVVIKLIKDAAGAFNGLATWVSENEVAVLGFVNRGLVALLSQAPAVLRFLDGMVLTFRAIKLASSSEGWDLSAWEQLLTSQTTLQNLALRLDDYTAKLATFSATHTRLTNQQVATENVAGAKLKSIWKSVTDYYTGQNAARLQNLQSTLGTIATMTASSNRTLFGIGKAAAMAQAAIDGVAAVQKALASAPPPFNFGLAALVGAATAVNVAKIAAQKPPEFAQGGIVPGTATSGDSVAIMANSREAVLTMDDQRELLSAIRGGGMGGGGVNVTLNIASLNTWDDKGIEELTARIRDAVRFRGVPAPVG